MSSVYQFVAVDLSRNGKDAVKIKSKVGAISSEYCPIHYARYWRFFSVREANQAQIGMDLFLPLKG